MTTTCAGAARAGLVANLQIFPLPIAKELWRRAQLMRSEPKTWRNGPIPVVAMNWLYDTANLP